MRKLVGILCLVGIVWPVGKVWAQVGLYGSPEVLQLPQVASPPTQPSASPATVPYTPSATAYRSPVASYPTTSQQAVAAPVEYQPPNSAYGRQWIATTNSAYGQPGAPLMGAGPNLGQAGSTSAPAVASMPRIQPVPAVAPTPTPAMQPGNLTNQMLGEAVPTGPVASPEGGGGAGESALGDGSCGCGVNQPCAESGPICEAPVCCPWYGDILFLYMCRNQPNRLWTTYRTDNEPHQIPSDINLTWAAGGQATVGYRFGCCCPWAIEATYWGLSTIEGEVGVTDDPYMVSTCLDVSWIKFGEPPVDADQYFDHAAEHRLERKDQIHSAEISLVRGQFPCGGAGAGACDPLDLRWGLGFRYFRFGEDWSFGSLQDGYEWGEDGGIHEAYMRDKITNDLYGFQVGCGVNYHWRPTLSLFVTPKVGVYNNQIHHDFTMIRGDGTVASPPSGSGVAGSYPVVSTKSAVAFLTEIDVGIDWQFTPRWSACIGYRAVVATGVGLADNQIPHYIFDIPVIREIDYNGEFVLHGGFAGLTYNY